MQLALTAGGPGGSQSGRPRRAAAGGGICSAPRTGGDEGVVDGDDVDARVLHGGTHYQAPDAAKPCVQTRPGKFAQTAPQAGDASSACAWRLTEVD